MWVLVSAAFVIALGFGIVAPALPQFAREFGVGYTAASAVISAFALMRLLFAPASGALVQRLGERPVYLIGLLIVAVSTGACALAQTYWQLLLFRGLGGIGSTMFSVSALGLLIRISPPTSRGRISGLYATAFLLGTIGGPLVGGALVGFGLRVPFVIYAVALVIAAAVVYFTLGNSDLVTPEKGSAPPTMSLLAALRIPSYQAALASNFANGWAVFGVRVALVPLFVVEAMQRSEVFVGIALTVFAVGNALVLTTAGRLSDVRGRKPFMVGGLAVCGLGTVVMGYVHDPVPFLVVSLIAGIGSGLMSPAQQASVADVIGSKARGGPVLAAFQMASDVGAVIGPIVAGMIVEQVSFGPAFAVTGALLLLAGLWWSRVPDTLGRERT
ncbi:MAG: MFS transporter [Rhodococcus sp. (in: high G+C Gram-positive bacteria)]|nr:MFS transporter [Rhodococcus sp. (in: high G+C Gram-positive bacteria)]MDI6629063.1 MFS transporter [Rhodococcus sp. (in: high G+C Gram-positive bacteria)]